MTPASTAAAPPASPISAIGSAPATCSPTTSGSPTGTVARTPATPYVPASAWTRHQRIHQYRGGHDETYGGVTINIDSDYVEGATVGATTPGEEDPKGRIDLVGSPGAGPREDPRLGLRPELARNARRHPRLRRRHAGGRRATTSARSRLCRVPTSAARHRAAGEFHGFDARFATIRSGRQRVCVYAVDVGPGSDSLLGCRGIGIGVAVTLSHLSVRRNGLRATLRCEWPAGTECPGRLLLRAQRPGPRAPARKAPPAAEDTGGEGGAGATVIPADRGTLPCLRRAPDPPRARIERRPGRLRAQLVIAIPGGRRFKPLLLSEKTSGRSAARAPLDLARPRSRATGPDRRCGAEQRSGSRKEGGMVLADVAAQRGEPDRLCRPRRDLREGGGAEVLHRARAHDQVPPAPVQQPSCRGRRRRTRGNSPRRIPRLPPRLPGSSRSRPPRPGRRRAAPRAGACEASTFPQTLRTAAAGERPGRGASSGSAGSRRRRWGPPCPRRARFRPPTPGRPAHQARARRRRC